MNLSDPARLQRLVDKIDSTSARIAVIGMGYVGLPVACAFAEAGFEVVGVERNDHRRTAISEGRLPLASGEPGLQELLTAAITSKKLVLAEGEVGLGSSDAVIIAVDTPLDDAGRPDYRNLTDACSAAARQISGDVLVCIESTVAPLTMRLVVSPHFQSSRAFLIHSPERLRPGRLLGNLRNLPRLIGAATPEEANVGIALYRKIVRAGLFATSWETAEVIKTAENAVRDIQIAIANQLAVVADYVGVDVRTVRDHVNDLWRNEPLVLEPGPGVGGHCLPKDPWLLVSGVPEHFSPLIRGARAMNDAMAEHVLILISRIAELRRPGSPQPMRIAALGLTYNADSDDTRNAPARTVVSRLVELGYDVATHDPFVTGGSISEAARDCDLILLLVAHRDYREFNFASVKALMRSPVILDCRRALDEQRLRNIGFEYFALGTGALSEVRVDKRGRPNPARGG